MKLLRAATFAFVAGLVIPAMGQSVPTPSDMQILAQKVKADKKLLIAVNMQLTETEAKGFWPIYDLYQKDLESLNNRLLSVISNYATAYNSGAVSNDQARNLVDEFLAISQDEAKMARSYVPKLAEVLPGAKVARYLQIETKIRAIDRYELARQIPLVQ